MATTELHATRFRASFAEPECLLAAVQRLRGDGYTVIDTYTPFPVHGMDEAMGIKPSRLPRACLAFAVLGLATALALQVWTSAFDYPLRVGGKPLAAIPAFIPVLFELTVLFAGLGVVASLFVVSRLRPRFRVPNLHPGVNDDRFVLAAEVQAGISFEQVRSELAKLGAVESSLLVDDRLDRPASPWDREVGPAAFVSAFLPAAAVLVLLPLLNRDFQKRNLEWDGGMAAQVSYGSFDPHPGLKNGMVLQSPPPGTLPRKGQPPLGFSAGRSEAEKKAEAERAGRELKNPFTATQPNFLRGKQVYERSCAACHGRDGDGASSALVARGLMAPTVLVSPVVKNMADGQIFYTATYGGPKVMKGLADLISREDRWKAILYIRELQKGAAAQPAAPVQAAPASPGAQP
jgi:mono/diheme cytochrome c family protein